MPTEGEKKVYYLQMPFGWIVQECLNNETLFLSPEKYLLFPNCTYPVPNLATCLLGYFECNLNLWKGKDKFET